MTNLPSNSSFQPGAGGIILLGLSYPLLAHVAVLSGRPQLIAASIGWLVVLILLPGLQRLRPMAWIVLATVSVGLYSTAGSSQAMLLLFLPPILIDGFMAWVFGHTLRRGRMPLIENIVRALNGPQDDLDDDVLRYTRRLTGVWSALFVALAVSNAVLALCAEPGGLLLAVGVQPPVTVPLSQWSLLANVLDYLLVGALFVIEFAYRKRRFPQQPYRGLLDFTRRVVSLGKMFRSAGAASQPGSTAVGARSAPEG